MCDSQAEGLFHRIVPSPELCGKERREVIRFRIRPICRARDGRDPTSGRRVWLLKNALLVMCLSMHSLSLAAVQGRIGGVIQGLVMEAKSGTPVSSATVVLAHAGTGEPVAETVSDHEGRFVFRDLADGKYSISAAKTGYLDLLPSASSTRITSVPTPQGKLPTIELIRTAVIAGRVLHQSGRAVRGMKAIALTRRTEGGEIRLEPFDRGVPVDDRGAYRLYDLPPGIYTVMVVPGAAVQSEVQFAPVYFPGVVAPDRAEWFALHAGESRLRTDLMLLETPRHKVGGAVLGAPGGWSGQRVAVSIAPVNGAAFPLSIMYTDAKGLFEFSGVPPGSYELTATALVMEAGASGASARRGARRVDVAFGDVGGVEVSLNEGVRIEGQLRFARSNESDHACYSDATVSLRPAGSAPHAVALSSRVTPRGRFSFADVFPGSYRVSLTGLVGECFLEQIAQGERMIENRTVTIVGDRERETLALLLTPRGGSVAGRVTARDDAPAPGSAVVLVPVGGGGEETRATATDANGQFEFERVAPGRYRLAAMKSINSNEYLDPLFWWDRQNASLEIAVKSGTSSTADLRISQ